jgi:hypothetical protein
MEFSMEYARSHVTFVAALAPVTVPVTVYDDVNA